MTSSTQLKRKKSFEEINKKIGQGEAKVFTAEEFKKMVRNGENLTVEDVDVVTTGTCGLMSGTAIILTITIAERGVFERAEKVWLNGVPAYPGPCPNERLGIIDVIVYGTSHADEKYGGGHLFRDIVENKNIEARIKTKNGKFLEPEIKFEDIPFARMFTTRSVYRNYVGLVNPKNSIVKTIFSLLGLKGPLEEVSVCGCGEINPLENDSSLKTIGINSKVLLNGSIGYVMGEGTRSTKEKPNLSVFAEMRGMEPKYMGGFNTSAGPECITSIAIPVPVLDEEILSNLKILDENIKLPILDINKRTPFSESDYGKVWQNTDKEISFNRSKFNKEEKSPVEIYCPTNAFQKTKGIDKRRCFNCGACTYLSPQKAFKGKLGAINIKGKEVPITLRQSNRSRANDLCYKLKKLIKNESFKLTPPTPLHL
ncbi:MAG: methanogenesis marker 16 metalloprotein [Candidatus Hodarchaeota archaeon]